MNRLDVIGLTIVGSILITTGASASRTTSLPTIEVVKAVHFRTLSGDDALLESGTYTVEAAEEWLKFTGGERRDAILVQAETINHDQSLTIPKVVFNRLAEGGQEVVLLLPEGKGLKATGTFSGVQSRGIPRSETKRQIFQSRPPVGKGFYSYYQLGCRAGWQLFRHPTETETYTCMMQPTSRRPVRCPGFEGNKRVVVREGADRCVVEHARPHPASCGLFTGGGGNKIIEQGEDRCIKTAEMARPSCPSFSAYQYAIDHRGAEDYCVPRLYGTFCPSEYRKITDYDGNIDICEKKLSRRYQPPEFK